MLKIFRNIRKLKKGIDILRTELLDIETNHINVYVEGKGFSMDIDKNAHRKKTTELKKQELLLGIVKFQKFLIVRKKSVLILLNDYIACLESELAWLNKQKIIHPQRDNYILDFNKINKMESFIKDENEKYQLIINNRLLWLKMLVYSMKKHKIVIGFAAFLCIPILAGLVVSIPSTGWLEKDNDWIGFWGSYIGGVIGAIIGGFVAYKVAEFGFKGQRELEKQSKVTELKINNLTKFIATICALQQMLLKKKNYIFVAYKNIKKYNNILKVNETITFESILNNIKHSEELIARNHIEIYDYLEKYQVEHETTRFLLSKYQIIIHSAYEQVLVMLKESENFEALFFMCEDESYLDEKTIDFNSFDFAWEQFSNSCKETDYLLYVLVSYLRNEISSDLGLPQSSIEDKEAYVRQRFI